jgi:hypothetical protein
MSAGEALGGAHASGVRMTVDGESPVLAARAHPRPDRSARPVKTRRNRRPDRRRVKLLRSYTIDEVARTLEFHRNTVRHWIKAGLPVIDHKRPILIPQASDPDSGTHAIAVKYWPATFAKRRQTVPHEETKRCSIQNFNGRCARWR